MEVTMKNVQTESVGGNFVITLINPAKRNALSLQVLHELIEAFGDAQKSDALGIVLAAQGPVFLRDIILRTWPVLLKKMLNCYFKHVQS